MSDTDKFILYIPSSTEVPGITPEFQVDLLRELEELLSHKLDEKETP